VEFFLVVPLRSPHFLEASLKLLPAGQRDKNPPGNPLSSKEGHRFILQIYLQVLILNNVIHGHGYSIMIKTNPEG
jgi:hypothetical protein